MTLATPVEVDNRSLLIANLSKKVKEMTVEVKNKAKLEKIEALAEQTNSLMK